jgi:cellulose synthase/poly-beta-1,6-N-acetylglucosamine synthase-like glycosyltransferase
MAVFLAVLALIAAAAAIHPFTTYKMSLRWMPQRARVQAPPAERRTVALCLSAYNEEKVIEAKAENMLEMARAYGPCEVFIYVDGAKDRTAELLEPYRDRITVIAAAKNQGKCVGLKDLLPRSDSPLIAFTDANVMGPADALVKLAAAFDDPGVGVATAALRYTNADDSAMAQSGERYWALQEELKALESQTVGVMGVDGALFMIRRDLYVPPPNHVPDDFFVSIMALAKGGHVVSVQDAVVEEKGAVDWREEMARKTRIACQSWTVLALVWPHLKGLSPAQRYALISTRPMKLFAPFSLGLAGAFAWLALASVWGAGVMIGLTALGAGAFALAVWKGVPIARRIAVYGASLWAVALGFWQAFIEKRAIATWDPAASVRD